MQKLLKQVTQHIMKRNMVATLGSMNTRSYNTPHLPLTMLKEEEIQLQQAVTEFAEQQIKPYVKEMDESKNMREDIIQECFNLGLMGIEVPEEYGGTGMSFMSSIIVIEALARIDPSVSVFVDVQNTLVNRIFRDFGSEEQKQTWLPKLSNEIVGSFCLSETSSGSDAFALKTTAKKDGDDYILNGTKAWITNSHEAGVFVVMANVKPEDGYRGITAFIVPRDTPGLTVAKKEDKLGIRASSTCSVILENVRVPESNILGELGKGYKIAITTLNEGRIGIGAQMVGLAQGAFDTTMPYLNEREQFNTPLSNFQGMQFQYAKCATDIAAARLMVYEAARLKEAEQTFIKEAAMCKWYSSEVANDVAMKCVEMLGGVGFTKEFDAEKYYRDCIIGKIYEGTSNINLQTIAKHVKQEYL